MAFDKVFIAQSTKEFPRTVARGVGQVMFQDNMWTGIFFLAGIFWGAYEEGFHSWHGVRSSESSSLP